MTMDKNARATSPSSSGSSSPSSSDGADDSSSAGPANSPPAPSAEAVRATEGPNAPEEDTNSTNFYHASSLDNRTATSALLSADAAETECNAALFDALSAATAAAQRLQEDGRHQEARLAMAKASAILAALDGAGAPTTTVVTPSARPSGRAVTTRVPNAMEMYKPDAFDFGAGALTWIRSSLRLIDACNYGQQHTWSMIVSMAPTLGDRLEAAAKAAGDTPSTHAAVEKMFMSVADTRSEHQRYTEFTSLRWDPHSGGTIRQHNDHFERLRQSWKAQHDHWTPAAEVTDTMILATFKKSIGQSAAPPPTPRAAEIRIAIADYETAALAAASAMGKTKRVSLEDIMRHAERAYDDIVARHIENRHADARKGSTSNKRPRNDDAGPAQAGQSGREIQQPRAQGPRQQGGQHGRAAGDEFTGRCFNCNVVGHRAAKCTEPTKPRTDPSASGSNATPVNPKGGYSSSRRISAISRGVPTTTVPAEPEPVTEPGDEVGTFLKTVRFSLPPPNPRRVKNLEKLWHHRDAQFKSQHRDLLLAEVAHCHDALDDRARRGPGPAPTTDRREKERRHARQTHDATRRHRSGGRGKNHPWSTGQSRARVTADGPLPAWRHAVDIDIDEDVSMFHGMFDEPDEATPTAPSTWAEYQAIGARRRASEPTVTAAPGSAFPDGRALGAPTMTISGSTRGGQGRTLQPGGLAPTTAAAARSAPATTKATGQAARRARAAAPSFPSDPRLVIDCSIDGRPLRALVDSGSTFSAITPAAAKKVGLEHHAAHGDLCLADGSRRRRIGTTDADMHINGKDAEVELEILELAGEIDVVVGIDSFFELGLYIGGIVAGVDETENASRLAAARLTDVPFRGSDGDPEEEAAVRDACAAEIEANEAIPVGNTCNLPGAVVTIPTDGTQRRMAPRAPPRQYEVEADAHVPGSGPGHSAGDFLSTKRGSFRSRLRARCAPPPLRRGPHSVL